MELTRIWTLLICFCIPRGLCSVVGLDLGSSFLKIALAAPGKPIQVVLNAYSKRKTPTAVSFRNTMREFGDGALSTSTKFPGSVVQFAPMLLGINITELRSELFPYLNVTEDPSRKTALINWPDKNLSLTPEGVMSNLLQFVGNMVLEFEEKAGGRSGINAVITVPESFSFKQRRALADAAEIAGVKVLNFVREVSAAALHHAIDLPANFTGKKLFVDVGAIRLQSCIVDYGLFNKSKSQTIRTVDVLDCEESSDFGGHHFTQVVADSLRAEANRQEGRKDAEPWPLRATQLINSEAEKVKTILSSNKAVQVLVDSLLQGGAADFKTHFTRERFESLIMPKMKILEATVKKTLQMLNMTLKDVAAVEVVGGGARVPLVQRHLGVVLSPLEIGYHVNGDEGMALGASLLAANLSSILRMKHIWFTDTPLRDYTINVEDASSGKLLKKVISASKKGKRTLKSSFSLAVHSCNNLVVSWYETYKKSSPVLLFKYLVSGIEEGCHQKHRGLGVPEIVLHFSDFFPELGLGKLKKGAASWKEKYQQLVPDPQAAKDSSLSESSGNSTGTNTTLFANVSSSSSSTASNGVNASAEREEKVEPKPMILVNRTRTHTLKCSLQLIQSFPANLNSTEKARVKEELKRFSEQDASELRMMEGISKLESFIYETRENLESEEWVASTDKELRTSIFEKLGQAEDWLYTEKNESTTAEHYHSKFLELQTILEPTRRKVLGKRENEKLQKDLNKFKDFFKQKLEGLNAYTTGEDVLVKPLLEKWSDFYATFNGSQPLNNISDPLEAVKKSRNDFKEVKSRLIRMLDAIKKGFEALKYAQNETRSTANVSSTAYPEASNATEPDSSSSKPGSPVHEEL